MKRYIVMTAALLTVLCCLAGCGASESRDVSDIKVSVESANNMTAEELKIVFSGTWSTSVVFIDNQDGIDFDTDTYEFLEDGTGTYTPEKGEPEAVSWDVTPNGDMEVLFEEKGEKSTLFEYISGNLVSLERDAGHTVETHLVKVYSGKEAEENQ